MASSITPPFVNPQFNNSTNSTTRNTLVVTGTFFGSAAEQAGIALEPYFGQTGSITYYSLYDSPTFALTGTHGIANVYGEFVSPQFSHTGSFLTTNAFGAFLQATGSPGADATITNTYSLAAELPTNTGAGAMTNLYTAYLGSGTTTLVGIGTTSPKQGLSLNAGISLPIRSTAVSLTANNWDVIIAGTATTAGQTITLPAPSASNVGQIFIFKDEAGTAGTTPVTISPASGTIDGAASVTINTNYGHIEVYSDGNNYYILNNGGSTATGFTWTQISAGLTMVAQNGYYSIASSQITVALPTGTTSGGSIVEIVATGTASTFIVGQAANQFIVFGNVTTTVGTGGSLTSTATGDALRLLCTGTANAWEVLSSVGNFIVT